MDLNELARRVTLEEGKKVSLSVAQVKEVLNVLGKILSELTEEEVIEVIRKLCKKDG